MPVLRDLPAMIIIFLDFDDMLLPTVAEEVNAVWHEGISKIQYGLAKLDDAAAARICMKWVAGIFFGTEPHIGLERRPARIQSGSFRLNSIGVTRMASVEGSWPAGWTRNTSTA